MKSLLDEKRIKDTEKFYDQFHQTQVDYYHYWVENTLWHWSFWLSIILTVGPWVLWFLFRKRGSEARLMLVGLFGIFIGSLLDFIGVSFGLWHYSGKMLPMIPTYVPWDLSLIPVTLMLWIQTKPQWNPFIKAIIYSGMASFIGEPVFEWLGLYTSGKWSVFYSFPIYVVIYLIAYKISLSKTFNSL